MGAGFDAIFFIVGILFLLAVFIWSARSRFREIDAWNNELDKRKEERRKRRKRWRRIHGKR